MLPKLIVHADWSKDPYKRWICSAILDSNTYRVSAPVPVQKPESLVVTSLRQANDHGVILGFDFPIGVPKAYADLAGFNRFMDVLPEFGKGLWKDFYKIAERPEDVTVYRPFYPQRCIHRGQATQSHLLAGIGVSEIMNLLRRCELGNDQGRTASYPTAPSQIPACGITAPGSSELLTSHIFAAQVFLEIMAYPRFD